MKSIKFTILLAFIALTNGAIAQLNGTYTIGGSSPDYATLQEASDSLQLFGISGAVVFNIRPGTYFQKVLFGVVAGTSATNTITFKSENGDSTSVIITDTSSVSASDNATIYIYNTDYLIFRDLTIERTGTLLNSTVISISANCKFLQFRNNIIRAAQTTSTAINKSLVYLPLGFPGDSLLTFANNVFEGGSIALNILGQSNANTIPLVQVTENVFNLQESRAIVIKNANAPTIRGNIINAAQAATSYRGIHLWRVIHNMNVSLNKIFNVPGGDIIMLDTCSGDVGNEGLIANNFLQSQGTIGSRGFSLNSCSSLRIYYNTVNITTTGTAINAAFNLNNAGSSLLNVRNNIFVNTGGGVAVRVVLNGLAGFSVCDYNDLFVGTSANLATFDVTNYATLADWQAGTSLDANSVSGDPEFFTSTDLHVDNAIVNNNAIAIPAVTTDIDGQSRSGSTPDIGADEFSPLLNNIGLMRILFPTFVGACGDSSTSFALVIRNFGLNSQTGFSVKAEITGGFNVTLSETYSSNLISNEIDTIYFSQTLNTYTGGIIDVVYYTSLSGDQNTDNDTLYKTYTFFGHPNAPTAVPQQVCESNVLITATPDSGDALAWFDQLIGGTLLHTGDTFSPVITTDTTFYVESRTGSGNSGCLRITEINPGAAPDFIEIQNVSGNPIDATGWVVAASRDNANIDNVNDSLWKLGFFNPGEVQYKTDITTDNYWGNNLLWTGGLGSWAMIIDNFGNIIDFVAWDYPADSIIQMTPVVNGFNITIGNEWAGPGLISCTITGEDRQRIGSSDNDDASDWACGILSKGTQNTNILPPFSSCGIGACGSTRIPVDVTLVPGISTNIGNDTIVGSTFLITLDAGPGFTSYLWSTGETTQTIDVNYHDVFWVIITGGPNNCTFSDTIVISLNVGISNLIGDDEISFYPNPTNDRLMISGEEKLLQSAIFRITDLQGRETEGIIWTKLSRREFMLDISHFSDGVYFLHITADGKIGTRKFVVLK